MMTVIEYIKQLEKEGSTWVIEGNLMGFITLSNSYPEVFTTVKIENFDGVKSISFETEYGDYTYDNFKFRNYKKLSLKNDAELSVTYDCDKELIEAILTAKTGIYKFLFDMKEICSF